MPSTSGRTGASPSAARYASTSSGLGDVPWYTSPSAGSKGARGVPSGVAETPAVTVTGAVAEDVTSGVNDDVGIGVAGDVPVPGAAGTRTGSASMPMPRTAHGTYATRPAAVSSVGEAVGVGTSRVGDPAVGVGVRRIGVPAVAVGVR